MNYLYIYFGEIPDYLRTSINSVLSVDKEAKIFLCSTIDPNYKNVNYINPDDIASKLTKEAIDLNIYKDTSYDEKVNKLWSTSLIRIFYLSDFLKSTNEKEVVHFDSDVMIYKPFKKLNNNFSLNKLNITELNNEKLVFGYSYIPNYEAIKNICKDIFAFINSKNYKENEYYKEHPLNEMEILGEVRNNNPNLFNILPDLPNSVNDIIFDPASYGQYLGGTHHKPKKWYLKKQPTLDHKVGQEIDSKGINVKFKNKEPIVSYENNICKIANLHVHSKNLNKFIPKGYKNYL